MRTIILIFSIIFISNYKSVAQTTCLTKAGYIAAISEKYLDDCIRYSVDKDIIALNKLIKAGVIIEMKAGIKVYVVETHLFSGEVEIRVPGETVVYWTVIEGLKCN